MDLKNLPVCTDFRPWDLVILTGGEPMIVSEIVRGTINHIRHSNPCPIILYTAKVDNIQAMLATLFFIDGLTVTLHEQRDLIPLLNLNNVLPRGIKKTLRLNVFKGINVPEDLLGKWIIKDNIEWIKNCPMPSGETFMRL